MKHQEPHWGRKKGIRLSHLKFEGGRQHQKKRRRLGEGGTVKESREGKKNPDLNDNAFWKEEEI